MPDPGSRSRFWRSETQTRICKHPLKMSCRTAVLERDMHTWHHSQIHHSEVALRPEPLSTEETPNIAPNCFMGTGGVFTHVYAISCNAYRYTQICSIPT